MRHQGMKCKYCGDPIYKFQEVRSRPDKAGKEMQYHKGCYEIILENVVKRVRGERPGIVGPADPDVRGSRD